MGSMKETWRELAVPGAWEVSPVIHRDDRGEIFQWFTESTFVEATEHRFDMRQANCSTSAAGVVRGLHFAQMPPGQAKYVMCVTGSVFDVVVDIRVGSPTYGRWDAVVLDGVSRSSMYLSEGLAHGFLALQDGSTVTYLCSAPYTPEREYAISPTDPEIGIAWPIPIDRLIPSPRDAIAPALAEVRAAGLLPTWQDTRAFIDRLPRA
jgi:dTDP-4-dehydrorhamnose 3,5-epimerase